MRWASFTLRGGWLSTSLKVTAHFWPFLPWHVTTASSFVAVTLACPTCDLPNSASTPSAALLATVWPAESVAVIRQAIERPPSAVTSLYVRAVAALISALPLSHW